MLIAIRPADVPRSDSDFKPQPNKSYQKSNCQNNDYHKCLLDKNVTLLIPAGRGRDRRKERRARENSLVPCNGNRLHELKFYFQASGAGGAA
jgi:hypothetical protein